MHRTKAGIILEKLLHESKHRWLWCWVGNDSPFASEAYDCACCITWLDDNLLHRCGCVCHTRIEEMASLPNIRMWLLAAEGAGELPKFFTSYHEKLKYCREVANQHAREYAPCSCETCEFYFNDTTIRRFPLNGEDNSKVGEYNCSVCSGLFVPDKEMIPMICPKCETSISRKCKSCDNQFVPIKPTHVWCSQCISEAIAQEKE